MGVWCCNGVSVGTGVDVAANGYIGVSAAVAAYGVPVFASLVVAPLAVVVAVAARYQQAVACVDTAIAAASVLGCDWG